MTVTTLTLNVTSAPNPSSTVAGQIAAQLAPGQWSSQLSTAQFLGLSSSPTILDRIAFNGGGADPSGMPAYFARNVAGTVTLLIYTGRSLYLDARGGEIWYTAGTTGWDAGEMTAIRYSIADDTFRHWQGATEDADGIFFPYGCSHGHEETVLDPTTGKLYRFLTSASDDAATRYNWLGVWDTATLTGTPVRFPTTRFRGTYPTGVWVDGLGAVYLFGSGYTAGSLYEQYAYNGTAWTTIPATIRLGGTDAPVACTHNGLGYFTNGLTENTTGLSKAFYRMNSAGTITRLADTPVVFSRGNNALRFTDTLGIRYDPNKAQMVALGGYIYAFHQQGQIYRYDVAGDAWTTYGTTPWVPGNLSSVTLAPIDPLGVVFAARAEETTVTTGTHTTAQLWKP